MDPNPPRIVETGLDVHEVSDEEYLAVLDACIRIMAGSNIPHCFMGGLASSVYGRDRTTHDLDLFVRPEDAGDALDVLADHEFNVERSNPDWIFKAERGGLLVDVIFCSSDGTLLDPELEHHIRLAEYRGRTLPVIPPEDLLITKVSAFREDTARQWFDCLAVLDNVEIDWRYLIDRSRGKPHRILSLLLFAFGNGREIPPEALRDLFEASMRAGRERAA